MSALFACLDASGRELHRSAEVLAEMDFHRATPASQTVVRVEAGRTVDLAIKMQPKGRAL